MQHRISLFAISILLISSSMHAQEIEWMSMETALEKARTDESPKKLFIDVYTDWCGWCKRMDQVTFSDPEVAAYMSERFYMVKFDGEQKEPVTFNGKTYTYVPRGRRGYHQLAAALMNGRLSYPTVVFMNEQLNVFAPVPGFRKPKEFMQVARYFGEGNNLQPRGPQPADPRSDK